MVLENYLLLRYVANYKVIDLYIEHSVSKEPKIVDDAFLIGWNNELHNTDDVVGNDVVDVVEDVQFNGSKRMNVDAKTNEHEGNVESVDSEHGDMGPGRI
ncbi:hypothetical protein Tco_1193505 [Tanacetum coccineum]